MASAYHLSQAIIKAIRKATTETTEETTEAIIRKTPEEFTTQSRAERYRAHIVGRTVQDIVKHWNKELGEDEREGYRNQSPGDETDAMLKAWDDLTGEIARKDDEDDALREAIADLLNKD